MFVGHFKNYYQVYIKVYFKVDFAFIGDTYFHYGDDARSGGCHGAN